MPIVSWEEVEPGDLVAAPRGYAATSHSFELRLGDEQYPVGCLRRNGTLEILAPTSASHWPWSYGAGWGKRVFVVAQGLTLDVDAETLRRLIEQSTLPKSPETNERAYFTT